MLSSVAFMCTLSFDFVHFFSLFSTISMNEQATAHISNIMQLKKMHANKV